MNTTELKDVVEGVIGEAACYECLSEFHTDLIDEYTGGPTALAICPYCRVDSVVLKDELFTQSRLMAMHVKYFHFTSRYLSNGVFAPDEIYECGNKRCELWDEYVKEIKGER